MRQRIRGIVGVVLSLVVVGDLLAKSPAPVDMVIQGRVTYGARPASMLWLRFVPVALPAKNVQTDADGRFSVQMASTAKVTVEFHALKNLSAGFANLILPNVKNDLSIELPDTTLRLNVQGAPNKMPAQLLLYEVLNKQTLAQHPSRAGIVTSDDYSGVITGLKPGRYRLVADSPGGYVSASPADFELKTGTPAVAAVQLLKAQHLMAVETDQAKPLQVVAFAGQRRFEGNPISLDRISPGMPVVVTSPGFIPKCVVLSSAASQRVKLTRQTPSVTKLIIGPEKAWPAGSLAGPEDACFIDADRFSSKSMPSSATSAIEMTGLGAGPYAFLPFRGAPLLELAPGRQPLTVDMPIGCNNCRSDYPAKIVVK